MWPGWPRPSGGVWPYHCGHLPSFANASCGDFGSGPGTVSCHCGPDLSGPRGCHCGSFCRFWAVRHDSHVRHDPPIRGRGAPTRSRIRISSFAGPQATQLVAQATADCPPLRSADCAPLYQASSPSRSQVTQASAQQPCVRAPPAHQTPDPAGNVFFRAFPLGLRG